MHSANDVETPGEMATAAASAQRRAKERRRGSTPAGHAASDAAAASASASASAKVAQTVQVGLRVRPLIHEETTNGHITQAWEVAAPVVRELELDMMALTVNERAECGLNRDGSYMFEHLFGPDSTNAQVYEQLAQPIVRTVCQGFNGTLFAYGQTSSGKTHTVMGDEKNLGLLFLALQVGVCAVCS